MHHQDCPAKVLVMDFGSQYTQLIARRVRELGIYSFIVPYNIKGSDLEDYSPSAVILSGGPASVYDDAAPALSSEVLALLCDKAIPTLAICYGMHYFVQQLGGKVTRAQVREYGRMPINIKGTSKLFSFLDGKETLNVWMSHGDEATTLPSGFIASAYSTNGHTVAAENPVSHLYLVQFHPEVTHSEEGTTLLKNFLVNLANVTPSWTMHDFAEEKIAHIRKVVGPSEHVICALSGGVDSCVAATIVHKALGDRLHCVFVDTGLLRYQEAERCMAMFKQELQLPVTCIDASENVLRQLTGVTDPEKKRQMIGHSFISIFERYARDLETQRGHKPKFLVQGTLYPDVIESSSSSMQGPSATIKSHHNVGGLPEDLSFDLIEPLRELFKDEVRSLGHSLRIPDSFIKRHPFPGPGLAIRIVGEVTPERVRTLQLADEIFIKALYEEGLYHEIWQAGALFLPVRSVGVQGDNRTHDYVIALRAVTSVDGMTADWYAFDAPFLAKVSNQIINEVPGVNRVVYDISSKPPATIEWE